MPGVVFLIVVPTANFEREVVYGGHQLSNNELLSSSGIPSTTTLLQKTMVMPSSSSSLSSSHNGNNLNINLPENNAILKLEVELRDKNAARNRRGRGGHTGRGGRVGISLLESGNGAGKESGPIHDDNFFVPMEKVLEELLDKLEIGHVTWSCDKKGWFHQIVFPLPAGEPCETTLHCLTELGIGTKLNSSVSVLPCSVSYDAISDAMYKDEYSNNDGGGEDLSKWNNFVESIKSKLTVKQVVDGVRAGGALSFDYLLLIVTADSLAALGLVENNAPNIVAAMLVSPLMGPVMSITFAAIISDRELMKVGFISLGLGMLISIVFGFIFGLILGTTEMPWGFGDWPTEEMRARGNARSLWMGILWALTSGTGVAVALLQGSAGPLIGVAISASLLPPVVNCGLFWALACIWLIYPDIKMPHLKGESYSGNSSYQFIYTNYLPTEFLINGIVSGLLTVINVICIFLTAIIVLKIKEVSAPYTASPDLKRFWTTDLGIVRKSNRSTIRKRNYGDKTNYEGLKQPRNRELDTVLEQAIKEATDDVTFKKVKRMSYSSNAAGELSQRLASVSGIAGGHGNLNGNGTKSPGTAGNHESARNTLLKVDPQALDKLVSALLEHQNSCVASSNTASATANTVDAENSSGQRNSTKLNRWRPLSRSVTSFMTRGGGGNSAGNKRNSSVKESPTRNSGDTNNVQHASLMPTIMEQNQITPNSSWSHRNSASSGVRNVLNTIANAPQRFSNHGQDEENINLTENILN